MPRANRYFLPEGEVRDQTFYFSQSWSCWDDLDKSAMANCRAKGEPVIAASWPAAERGRKAAKSWCDNNADFHNRADRDRCDLGCLEPG
jgi:hypothetical protein